MGWFDMSEYNSGLFKLYMFLTWVALGLAIAGFVIALSD